MDQRPRVTWAEFERIPCNRCGACCERLWMPSPDKLTSFSGANSGVENPSREWRAENRRFIAWIAALEPTGRVNAAAADGYTHQYRCSRFTRMENGEGFCTAYDDRPNACRGFPYGKPVSGDDFQDCSYNVDIVSSAWPWRLLRWIAARVS